MKKFISHLFCLGVLSFFMNANAQQTFTTYQAASLVVGQSNFTGEAFSCSQSSTDGPSYCAISSKGMLAVANQMGDNTQLWTSTVTSNGQLPDFVLGESSFSVCSGGISQSLTGYQNGVAFSPDGNKIFVADASSNRVLIWNSIPTSNGQPADVVLGQTDFTSSASGTAANKFNCPTGIYVSASGKLIVADHFNSRVLIWNSIPTVNGTPADVVVGQTNFTSLTTGNAANQMYYPWGVWVSPDGKLLIVDAGSGSGDGNNRVLIFNSIPTSNNANADVVIGQTGFGLSTGGLSQTQFTGPLGVTVSPGGKLAIGDFGNNRVLIYNSIPTTNGAAADVVLGQPNFTTSTEYYPGGTPSSQNMYEPYNVSFDLNGRLFVAGRDMYRVMIFGTLPSQQADLQIKISAGSTTFCPDSSTTMKVTLTNNGPDTATGIISTASLPVSFTFNSYTVSAGAYDSTSGYWNLSSLAPGDSAVLTISGTSTAAGTFSAYANIIQSDQLDNNLSNNGASINFDVNCPCSGTPNAGSAVSSANPVCGGTNFILSLTGASLDGGITYQWQSSPDSSTWSNMSGGISDTLTTSQTASNYYRCKVTCTISGLTSISSAVKVIENSASNCFCTPASSTYPCDMWISNVTTSGGITNFNNSTGCAASSYTDYSGTEIASNDQLATTTLSFTSSGYALAYSVWVDFNDDGVFESSERVIADNNTTEALTITDNFTVPITATPGTHKMRVRGEYYSDGAPTDPCSQLMYGETEDYGFTVIALTPCTGTPDPGNTLSTSNPVCPGINFTLTLQNSIAESAITYQWQSSPDDTTWINISGANNTIFTTSQTDSAYYRCFLTCTNSGLSSYSIPIFVTMNSSNNCYCKPTVIDSTFYAEYGNYLSQVSLNGSPNMVNNTGHTPSSTQSYTFYSPVSGATTTTLYAGSTYNFGAQCGELDDNFVSAWIDFNHDGVFSSSEMIANGIYISTVNTTYSSGFTVPSSAVNGTVRMRVILNEGTTPTDPCGTYTWADVEDYEITLINVPCTGTPTADTTISSANPVCSGTSFTLSLSPAPSTSGLTYQWQSSPNNSTWTNMSGATSESVSTTQTDSTYYRCIVTCSNSGLSSNSTSLYVKLNPASNCYCIPSPSTDACSYMWISNVTASGGVTNFNNSSGCAASSYTDYSSSETTSNIQLSTTTMTFTSGGYAMAFSVWIDNNDDGIFENSERVIADNNTAGALTFSDNFTVPIAAIPGTHKMRVRGEYYTDGAPTDPCSQLMYGETEDYAYTVIALTPCTGTPDPGNTLSNLNPVCSGVNFTLSLQYSITTGGINYQWQSSPNGSTWINISGATNDTLTTSQTDSTYYRCVVTCTNSGLSANSTSLYVTMNSAANCYCTPTVNDCNLYAEYGNYLSQVSLNGTPNMVNNTGHSISSTQCYTLYSPVVGTTTTSLNAGSTYSFGAQCGDVDANYVSAWIDYNHDGVFSSSEMIANGIYLSTANTTYSSNFTVPVSAFNGTVHMRVILNYNTTPTDPCGVYTWADVEDYDITIVNTPCAGLPVAGTAVSSANPVCIGKNFTLSLSGTTFAGGLTYQWQSSPDNSTWANISGGTSDTLTTSQTVSAYYHCIVTCSNSGLSSNSSSLNVTMSPFYDCYCIPVPSTSTSTMWISNVKTTGGISNFNNSTACAASSYTDYSSSEIASNSQLDTTTMSFTSSGYAMAFSVWIDFNDDGIFESSERVITDSNVGHLFTVSDIFTVPINVTPGTHRMRVRGDYYNYLPLDPCSQLKDGETEDYAFTVVCATNPLTQPPVITKAGIYIISNATAGNQWYYNNTIISGATAQVYIPTSAGYYYCIVSGGNACVSDTSNVIYYSPTGIETINEKLGFSIYPDPASDNITIEYNDFTNNQTISVYDIQGQLLIQQPMLQAKTNINIALFSKGLYFLKVESKNGMAVKKFVKE